MDHSLPLITTLVGGFVLAYLFGMLAQRLRISPMVGYLAAGVVCGPFTPGYVADLRLAPELAEIGVILLMFGIGLHFSLKDLLSVKHIAIPGAIVQITLATLLGLGLSQLLDWSITAGLVFGLALSTASTVVLLRALESRGQLDTKEGRIAIGWLIVEDLVMVLALVLLPILANLQTGDETLTLAHVLRDLGFTLAKVAAFIALMTIGGRRLIPWMLARTAATGSRELFTLAVLSCSLGIAFGAVKLFGVSFALGAFFAGMVLNESELSHRAAHDTLPLRDAFAVLFFVSVGMLFNPSVLWDRPLQVLAVVAIIMVGKTVAAAALVLAFRYPLHTALTVSASLAQIGEFSFILVALGASLGMLPPEGASLVLAGALISMALNPMLFHAIAPLQEWLRKRSALARRLEQRDDPLAELPMSTDARYLARQVVLVGYGRVGRRVADALAANDIPFVVAEQNRELVEALRESGIAAVFGDAVDPVVLIQAHIARAAMLVIATPDTLNVQQIITTARTLNPSIEAVVRSHSADEARRIAQECDSTVFVADEALAQSMARHVLERNEARHQRHTGPASLHSRV